VQGTAGLNAGQNAHVVLVCHVERSRDISDFCIISAPEWIQRFLDFARNDKLVEGTAGLNAGQMCMEVSK